MLALLFLLMALAGLAIHLLTCAMAGLRLMRANRPRVPGSLPPVALLRPVCGVDRFDAETLASGFALDHPDYETVFCAAGEGDPAVALVRRLIAEHPQARARLLVGDERIGANPKLNNLLKGWEATDQPVVVMADSNLMLPPTYLRDVAGAWGEGVGMVSSPAVGTRPEGLWAAVECAFLNTNQARLQLAADGFGRGFAQGKTLAFRRAALEAWGGMRALGLRVAEDASATIATRRAGLRVKLTPAPYAQPIGHRTRAQVWERQLRWSKVRRDGFPGLFLWEPLNGAALPTLALACALGAMGAPLLLVAPFLALWWGTEALLAVVAGWPMGWRGALALALRDGMIPALWVATFLDPAFEWRGTAVVAEDEAHA